MSDEFCFIHNEIKVPKDKCFICSLENQIQQLKQQLEDLNHELNNSKSFHCPNFLTNDSGYVSCQVKEYGYNSYENLFKDAVELLDSRRGSCAYTGMGIDFEKCDCGYHKTTRFLAKYRGE